MWGNESNWMKLTFIIFFADRGIRRVARGSRGSRDSRDRGMLPLVLVH